MKVQRKAHEFVVNRIVLDRFEMILVLFMTMMTNIIFGLTIQKRMNGSCLIDNGVLFIRLCNNQTDLGNRPVLGQFGFLANIQL